MFTYMDLCAGIGGFRLAADKLGGQCVLTCEMDKFARKTYNANFDTSNHAFPFDVVDLATSEALPPADIVFAGFPCQPYSVAGRGRGLEDIRGQVIYSIIQVAVKAEAHTLVLENVKNLLHLQKGTHFRAIKAALRTAGFSHISYQVVPAWSKVPQIRYRAYIAASKYLAHLDFASERGNVTMLDIKDDVSDEKILSEKAVSGMLKRRGKISVFGDLAWGLTSRYRSYGRECSVWQGEDGYRLLSLNEARRLMGFPDNFVFPVSKTQAFKQLGNAAVPPVVEEVLKCVLPQILPLDK